MSLLLLVPATTFAAINCQQITGQNAQTTCENTAGCHWENECYTCVQHHYCPGDNNAQILCSTAGDGTFSNSDEGATSAEECFKPDPITCEKPDGTPDNTCRHYNTNTNPYRCRFNGGWRSAHMEDDDACYYNIRYCKNFNNIGCDTFLDDQLEMANAGANWQQQQGQWNVQRCVCTNGSFTDNIRHCNGTHSYVLPESNTVNSATGRVEYNKYEENVLDLHQSSSYYCASCQEGYYVSNTHQSSNPTGFTYCKKPDSASVVVCNCEEIPKGWYVENCNWDANNLTSNPCPKNRCPAGQTSDAGSTDGSDSCHYSQDTKFCDAKGCFSLTEAELRYWGLIP